MLTHLPRFGILETIIKYSEIEVRLLRVCIHEQAGDEGCRKEYPPKQQVMAKDLLLVLPLNKGKTVIRANSGGALSCTASIGLGISIFSGLRDGLAGRFHIS
ncbi:hypothetical protein SAMN05660235_02371 [Sporolituus thermophilus DSM 23256]|uniref:Uncharacterized protein n=1 Tax=Sporolituus thermophilus DSM 23256 TaxID=1123285 RepID=A0A1G7N133_9FIRM|nr:hypothetical protein SAMN05660235_02371 [Sporolituus thermophilus DSM 23256]